MTLNGNESPVVIDFQVESDSTVQWKEVVVNYDNDLTLTLIPLRDDNGNIVGLEAFTLVHHEEVYEMVEGKVRKVIHDEAYAYYKNDGSSAEPKVLKVSKRYLGELLEIALQDYLYWEYKNNAQIPKIIYAYLVAETTREMAYSLRA